MIQFINFIWILTYALPLPLLLLTLTFLEMILPMVYLFIVYYLFNNNI